MLELGLTVLSLVCLVSLFIYRRQTRRMGKELQGILSQEPTNRLLSQEVTSKEVTLLVSSINKLLQENRNHARLYHKEAETLQQSLTHLSHDLRTPLAALEGYLQLLSESDSEEDRKRYEAILKERMSHTKHLMDQYFQSLKYESKDLELPLSPINPNEVLLQCLLSFAPKFEEKNWEPEINLFPEEIRILAHKESLIRVFQNLIQNALLHGEGFFKVESKVEDNKYVLTMSNGLKEGQHPDPDRIFERFYKGDAGRTVESTGLGMNIVKSLVEHMKGDIGISIDSEYRCILEFSITF